MTCWKLQQLTFQVDDLSTELGQVGDKTSKIERHRGTAVSVTVTPLQRPGSDPKQGF